MFRLRFDIGEFTCSTALFPSAVFSNLELKEDMTIDINDAKHMKISLIAVKART